MWDICIYQTFAYELVDSMESPTPIFFFSNLEIADHGPLAFLKKKKIQKMSPVLQTTLY